MKNLLLIIFCAFTAIALKAQPPSIEALRTCAAEKGMSPKEYIFKLFEKSDIVVLGERDHRDTIQYDLIHDILADPRFAEQVGHVYTEVGSYNMTDDVNRLLQGVYPTEAVFMDSLYAYYRKSETFYPIWEKSNRVKFLKGIYEVNRTSPKKIKLGLTDCEFSWDEIRTVEDFKKFWKSPGLNRSRQCNGCPYFGNVCTPDTLERQAQGFGDNQSAACHQLFDDSQKDQYGLWSTGLVDEEKLWRRKSQNRGTELV